MVRYKGGQCHYLSENPNAIHLLEHTHYGGNPEKIDWDSLSLNSNAIHLLEHAHYGGNLEKIDWYALSLNLNIFEYDYQAMKDHMYKSGLCEELMAKMFHPDNIRNGKVGDCGFEDMLPPVKD